jgi:cytochrome P450
MKGDQLNPAVPKPDVAFGYGRRVCPGQDFAETSVWITMASLLSVFDITPKDGLSKENYGLYGDGLIS